MWSAAASEPVGFREYVAASQDRLIRASWLLTGDEHAAQDLLQTKLMRVWPRWERLVATGDPDAYVRRALANNHVSAMRRSWRNELPVEDLPEGPVDADFVADSDLRDLVVRLLPGLPPRQRAVLVMRYLLDLPDTETAAILGCSEPTVRSQAFKGLRTLRLRHSDPRSEGAEA
jgi:RNA polymerase sigma-70 factor (sigma-E family)